MIHTDRHNETTGAVMRAALSCLLLIAFTTGLRAQVTIEGNVFGGGKSGAVNTGASGDTGTDAAHVVVNSGTIDKVYGGGQEGDTKGGTTVTLRGGTVTDVFGGAEQADISGSANVVIDGAQIKSDMLIENVYGGNDVSGNIENNGGAAAAANVTSTVQTNTEKVMYVSNLYGGGNGDYDYTSGDYSGLTAPDLATTSVALTTGYYGNVYAGGNKATVTGTATLSLNNAFTLTDDQKTRLIGLTDLEQADLGWQFGRVFGGNNKVAMAIRPTWNLARGSVHDLYSGGNKGAMTYPNGIVLELNSPGMTVENVYGGCRIADVVPTGAVEETIGDYTYQAGFGARVRITAGNITNVYGGNDITGNVYYGTNVIIESSIIGDVYGGGNGSYAYTNKDEDSDLYFSKQDGMTVLQSLKYHRPNSENVNIEISGTDKDNKTYIAGSVYCGGNSATLLNLNPEQTTDPRAKLTIGHDVIVNNVFLGSNGENMITEDVLKGISTNIDEVDLTKKEDFDAYMEGVDVSITPSIEILDIDNGYEDSYDPTYIGSFFCGGNVGSMSAPGTFGISFLNSVIIFDKLVGGCNNANIPYNEGVNAFHQGGLTAAANPKVKMDIEGLRMLPKKLTVTTGADGKPTFTFNWNTYDEASGLVGGYLKGGNIYGGCYNSGYVNGDVVINLRSDLLTKETMDYFEDDSTPGWDEHCYEPFASTLCTFGGGFGSETEIWGNASINIEKNAHVLKVRGGGEQGWIGKMARDEQGHMQAGADFETKEPDNSTTVSYPRKEVSVPYDATVTLDANQIYDGDLLLNNVGEICAGGQEGVVTGNTHLNLNNGSTFCAFGGASNSDIYGGTEVLIGQGIDNFPVVTETVYGGNDFGGQVMGTMDHTTGVTADGAVKTVRSNTYVGYFRGEVGYEKGKKEPEADPVKYADYGIFAGAFGKYEYESPQYAGKFTSKPNMMSAIALTSDEEAAGFYAANTYLDISSKSTDAKDHVRQAYGGSEGMPEAAGVANVGKAYVLLNSLNPSEREGENSYLSEYVYGGGDCSQTFDARMDVRGAYAKHLFGGCHGMSNVNKDANGISGISYMTGKSTVNLYDGLVAPDMDVFGAGAFSGSKVAEVNIHGGQVNNVYGSQIEEGVTYLATVNVPSTSTARVNGIFGGGKGLSEANACDTYITHVNYNGAGAIVDGSIYGGNDAYRISRNTFVDINVPVRKADGTLADIYGAGFGQYTLAGQTKVRLAEGAQVMNAYGGGSNGNVYNMPSFAKYLEEKDYQYTQGRTYFDAYDVAGFAAWKAANADLIATVAGSADSIPDLNADATADGRYNAQVIIYPGAEVTDNVYGGGYGNKATVAGRTYVELAGGDVSGNIYGGGYGGSVADELYVSGDGTISTTVNLVGGNVTNAFGGGYEGAVGSLAVDDKPQVNGNSYVTVGIEGYDYDADGNVLARSDQAPLTHANGDPAIERSLYCGGEKGPIHGDSYLTFLNGHVGYTYDETDGYAEKTDYKEEGDKILLNNGNVFGGGYGEGATVLNTHVVMKGGTIRNGLYGGGEIASVGVGSTKSEEGTMNKVLDREKPITEGSANVTMYKGHVLGDVFGGGRGYSFDLNGLEVTGKIFFTDGYVFGKTEALIYGGEVGTAANVKDSHGNVFGGGNVGFVYSVDGYRKESQDAEGKPTHYYYESSDPTDLTKLTEDSRVLVSPYAQVRKGQSVTLNGTTYGEYEFVKTDDLNYLLDKNADKATWDKLDTETGVTIHNAVFAGGNVSSGSDKLFANTTTIYGNSTATLYDVYHRDLIMVGTDEVGGLYGDGNLTLVDGYRELNITNYGTDYYGLNQNISLDEYNALNDRERAYFELKYVCTVTYTGADGKTYTKDESTLSSEDWSKLPADECAKWTQAGFCSIYAGRLLNTIQRADFVGVFGSRVVLEGAIDRVVDTYDKTLYAINRVRQVSLNKKDSKTPDLETSADEKVHGNYFGLYNIVNYLEALTSDVDFYKDVRTADTQVESIKPDGTTTYYEFKKAQSENKTKYANNATSLNKVALATGVYLELVREPAADNAEKEYGPVTGVIELDLMNTQADAGGAYVYAKNNHKKRDPESVMGQQLTLAKMNDGAKTYNGVKYTDEEDPIQSSGNFVNKIKQIYDDCYPDNGDHESPAHYWFVRGTVYYYSQKVSAYTGSSTAYKSETQIPLTISLGTNGKLKLESVQQNYYAYWDDKANATLLSTTEGKRIADKTYMLNDVISWWTWTNLSEADKSHFVPDTYVAVDKFRLYNGDTLVKEYANRAVMLPADLTLGNVFKRVNSDGTETVVSEAEVVRKSNGMNHDKGYILTSDVTNPEDWNDLYYDNKNQTIVTTSQYKSIIEANPDRKPDFVEAPSYKLKSGSAAGVYGQKQYKVNDIINQNVVNDYNSLADKKPTEGQAVVETAYVSVAPVAYEYGGIPKNLQEGVAIPLSEYNDIGDAQSAFEPAYVCIKTVNSQDPELSTLSGELRSQSQFDAMKGKDPTVEGNFTAAYICSQDGKYAGYYFETGKAYPALTSWCEITEDERRLFQSDGDALNLYATNLDRTEDMSDYGTRYSEQKSISGESPIETSTLYVPASADIRDLLKDQVVSVVFEYQYDEATGNGDETETVTEKHVIDITVSFLTGEPEISKLLTPGPIFPGTTMGLRQPTVSEGAYQILGGGWEIYTNKADADAHQNGVEYVNNQTPMYFYQDGYYTAYYTKTYLGKTYSNAVPVKIVNYHRMEDVMTSSHVETDDAGNKQTVNDYMYLNEAAARVTGDQFGKNKPKVYIDAHGCDDTTKSELDYFAQFINDTYTDATPTKADLTNVKGGERIDFILQSDVAPVATWTSVGDEEQPFKGTFHGMGNTVTDMTGSLFGHTDGDIYNTGVLGTFTGSGIADAGTGKAVNCWVWNKATSGLSGRYAVMGNNKSVNCYYADVASYKSSAAVKETVTSFSNGKVAYLLNDFYLNKRWQDSRELTDGVKYGYKYDTDSGLALDKEAYYPAGTDTYVEDFYSDEDFTYAGGVVPMGIDPRLTSGNYYPIYPDDYVFFGQDLTYGIYKDKAYVGHPVAAAKNTTDFRLVTDGSASNRVYRLPAYFGTKNAGTAYVNRLVAFTSDYSGTDIHKGLTAVDFTGYVPTGDEDEYTDKAGGYKPVLDFGSAAGFATKNITANLLVYAAPADTTTYVTLRNALTEPTLDEDSEHYSRVAKADRTPKGHLVDRDGTTFTASRNHFLADGNDFNCPIAYTFGADEDDNLTYMWHQRTPSAYADIDADGKSIGWETIVLPFTADLVSTQTKGALTHFFNTDDNSHEYWLRGFRGGSDDKATFLTPVADDEDAAGFDGRYKKVSAYPFKNTFLYDWYYKINDSKDANSDKYKEYYNSERVFTDYPLVTENIPYLISFPGKTYFEFDLSGEFSPVGYSVAPGKVDRQIISFVSVDNQRIAVTDDTPVGTTLTDLATTMKGTYSSTAPLTESDYVLSADGASFTKVSDDNTKVAPFRAWLNNGATSVKEIFISEQTDITMPDHMSDLTIEVTAHDRRIFVTNHRKEAATVRVVNTAGSVIAVLTVKPGMTLSTGVLSTGVYIAGRTKLMVR